MTPRNRCIFRRRPDHVEAVQVPLYEGETVYYLEQCIAIADWCGGGSHMMNADDVDNHITVPGPDGPHRARPLDFVIRKSNGNFLCLSPEDFFAAYEPAMPLNMGFAIA